MNFSHVSRRFESNIVVRRGSRGRQSAPACDHAERLRASFYIQRKTLLWRVRIWQQWMPASGGSDVGEREQAISASGRERFRRARGGDFDSGGSDFGDRRWWEGGGADALIDSAQPRHGGSARPGATLIRTAELMSKQRRWAVRLLIRAMVLLSPYQRFRCYCCAWR